MKQLLTAFVQSDTFNALVHAGKVLAFIFVSGGLSALLDQVGSLKLSATQLLLVTGAINALLAWLNKYREQKGLGVL